MTLKDAALKYARDGFSVLPVWWLKETRGGGTRCACGNVQCETPGKHPLINAWQKKATDNTKQIGVWWQRWPDAHIGIMPKAGTCVIDIDPRNGGDKTLRELLGGESAPLSIVQLSGGGGWHIFYEGEPSGTLGTGIDVKRAGRGFVVAAPSMHESGRAYAWREGCAPWEREIAPLPEALDGSRRVRKSDKPGSEFSVVENGEDTSKPVPKVKPEDMAEALGHIEADDYARWINIGHALRHAYGDKNGFELWEAWSRTSDKFQEHDLNKWNSFDRNRDRALWTIRSVIALARKGGYRPLMRDFDDGDMWLSARIGPFREGEPKALEWAFKDRIPCGKVTVIAGSGGSSKSFLMSQLAIAFGAQQALGPFEPGTKGKALILTAEEDKDDVHRRVNAIAKNYDDAAWDSVDENCGIKSVRGLDFRMLQHDEMGDLQETGRVDEIISVIKNLWDVKLLVIDPLIYFNGGSENDNEEMGRLMVTLDRVAAETGAAVVVVHHASKGGQGGAINDATQAAIRGASALVDNARAAMLVSRIPAREAMAYGLTADDAQRFIALKFVKNNYGPYMPDTFFEVGARGVLRHAAEISRIEGDVKALAKQAEESDRNIRLLRAIVDGEGELTLVALAEKSGLSIKQVRVTLKELAVDGLTDSTGIGAGKRYDATREGKRYLLKSEADRDTGDS